MCMTIIRTTKRASNCPIPIRRPYRLYHPIRPTHASKYPYSNKSPMPRPNRLLHQATFLPLPMIMQPKPPGQANCQWRETYRSSQGNKV